MKLKKLLEGLSWERKPGQPLPTLKDTTKAHSLREQAEGFDYDYYIKQIEGLIEAKEEVEYELIQALDTLAEDEAVTWVTRGWPQPSRYPPLCPQLSVERGGVPSP